MNSLPGSSCSAVNGRRLNGSVFEFSKCLVITERSIVTPLGKITGSVITVHINGSEKQKPGC